MVTVKTSTAGQQLECKQKLPTGLSEEQCCTILIQCCTTEKVLLITERHLLIPLISTTSKLGLRIWIF